MLTLAMIYYTQFIYETDSINFKAIEIRNFLLIFFLHHDNAKTNRKKKRIGKNGTSGKLGKVELLIRNDCCSLLFKTFIFVMNI